MPIACREFWFSRSNTKRHFQARVGDILLVSLHCPSAKLLTWHKITCLKHLKSKQEYKRLMRISHQGLIICFFVFLYCSLFFQLPGCKPRWFVSLHFSESHVKRSCYTYSTGTPLTRRIMLDLTSWSHFRRYSGFLAAHMLQHQCSELLRGGLAVEVMQDWIAGDEICAVVYHSWRGCWEVRANSTKVIHFWKLAFCPILNV